MEWDKEPLSYRFKAAITFTDGSVLQIKDYLFPSGKRSTYHWQDAKKPFLSNLAGLGPMILGIMLMGAGAASAPMSPDDDSFSSYSSEYEDEDDASDFFAEPTSTPLPYRPTPTVLNRSPIPTRTPIPPTSTPIPTATPIAAQLAAQNLGRVLELYLHDGRSVKVTLTGTDEENLFVTRRIGGGAISYSIRKDSVRGFKVVR